MLVIAGQDDNVSPAATGEAFAKELPKGSFELVQQCGHWQPIEQPAAVNAALGKFFGND